MSIFRKLATAALVVLALSACTPTKDRSSTAMRTAPLRDSQTQTHTLTIAFAAPIQYRPSAPGNADGPAASTLSVMGFDLPVASGRALAHYTTESGDQYYLWFMYDPSAQTLVDALQAALDAAFPTNQPTITYL